MIRFTAIRLVEIAAMLVLMSFVIYGLIGLPTFPTSVAELKDNFNAVIGSAAQVVNVHPDWAHAYKQPDLLPDHETEIAKRDPSTMSGPDLSSCFAMFGFYGEQDHLLTLLEAN